MDDVTNQLVLGQTDRNRRIQFLPKDTFRTLSHEPAIAFFALPQRLFCHLALRDINCRGLYERLSVLPASDYNGGDHHPNWRAIFSPEPHLPAGETTLPPQLPQQRLPISQVEIELRRPPAANLPCRIVTK